MENLVNQVQILNSGTSFNYVCSPSKFNIQADMLLALKRFKNSARWREFFRGNQSQKDESDSVDGSETPLDFVGLGTKLKPFRKLKYAPRGTEALEKFLHHVETLNFISTQFLQT